MQALLYAFMATLSMTLSKSFVKYLTHIPVEELIFFRMIFALLITLFIIKKQKIDLRNAPKKILFSRGLFGTLGLFFLLSLIKGTRFDSAIALHHLTPIFSIIFAAIFLKERLKLKTLSPLILVFIGLFFLQQSDLNLDLKTFGIGIISSIFAALAYICIRYLKQKVSTHLIILAFPIVCLPLITPFVYFNWINPTSQDSIYLFLMALCAWLGQFGLTKAYQLAQVAKVVPINYLNIPLSILLGHFYFQELISTKQILSIALIILGVFLTQLLQKRIKH